MYSLGRMLRFYSNWRRNCQHESASSKGFELDADEAEALTGGRWLRKRGNMVVRGAADSREVRPGAILPALMVTC